MYTAKNHTEGPDKYVVGGELKFEPRSTVNYGNFICCRPVLFTVEAENAVALSNTGVHAAVNLTDKEQEITTDITNPAVPRNAIIKGSASGMTGNVIVNGTNYYDEEISETLALNGTSAVEGNLAFKTYTSIIMPEQTHTPAAQVETATVVGTITKAGNASVVVTCTGMTGSPKTLSVAVDLDDDAEAVAAKIRAALADDDAVTAMFEVGGVEDEIVLTRLAPAANISNLNIAIDNDTCEGLTTAATSEDTTAGVAYDTVSVGWGNKLGLPFPALHNTVLLAFLNGVAESTPPTVTVSGTEIESNTVKLNSALNGTAVAVYYLAV